MVFALYILRVLCVAGVLLACVYSACFVYAAEPSLRITEIMYDAEGSDDGKEFVEVVNDGSEAVDMTQVKFFERNDRPDRPGRSLAQSQGDVVLPSGGVAVIVAKPELFLQQYSFDGVVLDTRNFAPLNAGATVSLELSGRLLHSVTYTADSGANGDGKSLHVRQDGSIVAGESSPGVADGAVAADSPGVGRSDAGSGAVSAQTTSSHTQRKSSKREDASLSASVVQQATVEKTDPPVFVSDPSVVFSASTTQFSVARDGDKGEALYGLWNFGDGTYTHGAVVEHVYLHPGAYIVVFQELGEDGFEGLALQKEIRVLFPQVSIERIDDAFVRLHNRHPFVLDVSGWRIESQGIVFDFPVKSFVLQQNSIVVPFAVAEGQDIFFVTAGGGQFSGAAISPDVTATDAVVVTVVEESEADDGDDSSVSDDAGSDGDVSVTDEVSLSAEEGTVVESSAAGVAARTDVFVEDVAEDQEEEYARVDVRMIVVWVVLFVGIMTVALVPFIFARREKARRFDHG